MHTFCFLDNLYLSFSTSAYIYFEYVKRAIHLVSYPLTEVEELPVILPKRFNANFGALHTLFTQTSQKDFSSKLWCTKSF
jgi:hypothetical protein